jgi:predicted Ser/Thr protein kinase
MNLNPAKYTDDAEPEERVVEFRVDKIINPINNYIWSNKDEEGEDLPIEESSALQLLLSDNDWMRVEQLYDNIDINQWRDPPEGSNTEELKEKTIDNMVEMGYTEESAEKATIRVFSVNPPNFGDS